MPCPRFNCNCNCNCNWTPSSASSEAVSFAFRIVLGLLDNSNKELNPVDSRPGRSPALQKKTTNQASPNVTSKNSTILLIDKESQLLVVKKIGDVIGYDIHLVYSASSLDYYIMRPTTKGWIANAGLITRHGCKKGKLDNTSYLLTSYYPTSIDRRCANTLFIYLFITLLRC